ncbi:MAG TPA: VCBS repeat-containing protein, partial [Pyrinomonadaceae bacterium]|nr:VCBS repeat-containing protein [Pyrinomonadaceae bacterium]
MIKTFLLVLAVALCVVGQTQPNKSNTPIFREVAGRIGLEFRHYNGMTGKFYLPEITGSGGAFLDFDNDGDLDVYLVQGNTLEPNTKPGETLFPWRGTEAPRGKLFRNDLVNKQGERRALSFTDVTEQSGIVAAGYGMGAAVGDVNNDSLPDLYLSNLGSNQMYLNKGDGKFADITKESGTDDPRWSTSASFFDYDRDGRLDLMIVNYADFS